MTGPAKEECCKCEATETPEWYRSVKKELICQDCYTESFDTVTQRKHEGWN